MEKVSYNGLKEIKKELLFYDFDNLNAKGNQIIIKFKDDFLITRFDDINYGGLSEDFETQACILETLMTEIIKYYNCESIIVAKYESNWIINKDKSLELTALFKSNRLRTNFSGAIRVSDMKIIKDFIYSNLKYNSFTHFILLENKIIITPTDHLDIFIASGDIDNTFNIVKKLGKKMKSNKIVIEKIKI